MPPDPPSYGMSDVNPHLTMYYMHKLQNGQTNYDTYIKMQVIIAE